MSRQPSWPRPAPTIVEARQALREQALTSEELVAELIARAVEADDNAYITVDADGAMAAAREADRVPADGPLHGIPLVVKDNVHVAGLPNTAGTPALAGFVPTRDATSVQRLRTAGAIVLGKANLHELALGTTSANAAHGAVRNPHDRDRVAGGSSGGTAAAIAAGTAVAGLGTDTGGSVRIPAAICGIYGLRPSTGRYPADGTTPLSWTRDTVGPMAASVEDLALLDAVLAGDEAPVAERSPAQLRLGLPADAFAVDLEPDVAARWERALDAIRCAGVTLVPVQMGEIEALDARIAMPVTLYEAPRALRRYLAQHETGVSFEELVAAIASPDVAAAFQAVMVQGAPEAIDEVTYRAAIDDLRPQLQRAYRRLYAEHALDAIVLPTTPIGAVTIADRERPIELGGRSLSPFLASIRNTDPSSNAGIPSVSIPLDAQRSPSPLGLMLDGPVGGDRALLGVARSVDALLA